MPNTRLRRYGVLVLGCSLAAGLVLSALARAEDAADPTSATAPSDETAASKIETAAISERLDDVRASLGEVATTGLRDRAAERAVRLRRIESLLEAQLTIAQRGQRTDPSAATEAIEAPDRSPPSAFELNRLYEARRNLKLLRKNDKALGVERREALDVSRERFESAERARRKARQALEQADAADVAAARSELDLRILDSRIAQEEVNLALLEVRTTTDESGGPSDVARIDAEIEELRQAHRRGEGDGNAAVSALTQRENELRRMHELAGRRLASIDLRLSGVESRFARSESADSAALAEAEALTALRDVVRGEIALIEAQTERLASKHEVWEIWTRVLDADPTSEQAEAWAAKLSDRLRKLENLEIRTTSRATDRERALELLELRLGSLPDGSALESALTEERDALSRLHTALANEVRAIAEDRRLTERALTDVRGETDSIDWAGATIRAQEVVTDTWNYELLVIDDSPITVGALILAIILIAVSVRVSNWTASLVRGVAEKRFALHPGGAQAFQTLTFYAFLVSFGLMALRAVHFPLTAFTVLGGALAIGVGFGSQNVMNNFISGLILMLERPVRAQDMVEVDGNHGTIEHIGARSTQIRSTDGRHIIVPNSFFLESNVVNWTLSDDLIRTQVTVGVQYGSPTSLVHELIQGVANDDEEILPDPAPIILFQEFGDNSLNFQVHFWVRARSPMGMRRVESRVRFEIDNRFREHDIVIAFPQRDVHLDAISPIEVKLTGGEATDGSRESSDERE